MSTVDQLVTARRALRDGENFLAAGDIAAARRWFDYASRIAPDDQNLALQTGLARLQSGDPAGAIALLQPLAKIYNRRELWLSLMTAYRAMGDIANAADCLQRLLTQFAMLPGAAMAALADQIAEQAGFPGWCGLNADGVVSIGAAVTGDLMVIVDDEEAIALHRHARTLPAGWERRHRIAVTAAGRPLLGSPLLPQALTKIEAFVEAVDGALHGWAWYPGRPDDDPVLTLILPDQETRCVTPNDLGIETGDMGVLSRPRGFVIPAADLGQHGLVRITGPNGQDITGSPLDPAWQLRAVRDAAHGVQGCFPADGKNHAQAASPYSPIRAGLRGVARTVLPVPRPIDIVIPVYSNLPESWACLQSLLIDPVPDTRIVVVEDASPEPALVAALETLAASGRILLLRQPVNRGFPATANAGMRHAAGRDVVLLNSDTLLPKGWLRRLQQAAYSAPDIGTVTPLSNDATIVSYPSTKDRNPVPSGAAVAALDRVAQDANGDQLFDIPVAVGFCMFIRHDCLETTGLLRDDVFAQGYGEEVDFCLRATALGWRHVVHAGAFVGHIGGSSFGGAKTHLIRRNGKILNALHPGFDRLVQVFEAADPLAPARRSMDRQRWAAAQPSSRAVLMISHARGGGVQRHIADRVRQLAQTGKHALLLVPHPGAGETQGCRIVDPLDRDAYPNLIFSLPSELGPLLAFLREAAVERCEWHHFLGHHPIVATLHRYLSVPQTMIVHDFSLFCPRITLTRTGGRYCGEPSVQECNDCIADHGSDLDDDIAVPALIERSTTWMRHAEAVIAPSADTARRLNRHFTGLNCGVIDWEQDPVPSVATGPTVAKATYQVRVCIVGAIGPEKGYDTILACAREAAARNRALTFHLVGFSCDDRRLLDTGHVHITGPFKEPEAWGLIQAQQAHVGFLPSQWPETWSYVLSDLREAGLPLVGFDIGAQADRIRAYGGVLLPTDMVAAAINDALMQRALAMDIA